MTAALHNKRGVTFPGAFTLVELMVAMSVFIMLMGILLALISQSAAVLQRTQNSIGSYQSARFAFNLMMSTIGQSRMNVYNDYDNPTQPTAYIRKSDLQFIIDAPQGTDFKQGNSIFFQAPLGRASDTANFGGLPGLMNSVGYYVTYGKNPSLSFFLQKFDRNRFRLMQFLAPAENMKAYLTNADPKAWYQDQLANSSSVIADNVILLLCWPRVAKQENATGDKLSKNYLYDSRTGATQVPQPITANQQPPLVQITLVAIDEKVANRLSDSSTPPAEITNALQGLFTKSTETDYTNDLAQLESRLQSAHIDYRVFSDVVPLRESKWSK